MFISGTTKALTSPASSRMRFSGNGQTDDQAQHADLDPLLARHLDGRAAATREVMP